MFLSYEEKETYRWNLFVKMVLLTHLKGYSSRKDDIFSKPFWYISSPEGRKASVQVPSPSAIAEVASSQSGCWTGHVSRENNGEKVPSWLQSQVLLTCPDWDKALRSWLVDVSNVGPERTMLGVFRGRRCWLQAQAVLAASCTGPLGPWSCVAAAGCPSVWPQCSLKIG